MVPEADVYTQLLQPAAQLAAAHSCRWATDRTKCSGPSQRGLHGAKRCDASRMRLDSWWHAKNGFERAPFRGWATEAGGAAATPQAKCRGSGQQPTGGTGGLLHGWVAAGVLSHYRGSYTHGDCNTLRLQGLPQQLGSQECCRRTLGKAAQRS